MAVEAPEQIDQIATDYQSRPEELDVNEVLLCLPGWLVEGNNTFHRTWYFKESNDRLWVEINSSINGRENRATITRFDQGRIVSRVAISDLRLVVAQVRPTSFCLGLYSTDGTYYLTKNRSDSPYLPDYQVSIYPGRNPEKVPLWIDRIPFLNQFSRRISTSHIQFEIPRIVTLSEQPELPRAYTN